MECNISFLNTSCSSNLFYFLLHFTANLKELSILAISAIICSNFPSIPLQLRFPLRSTSQQFPLSRSRVAAILPNPVFSYQDSFYSVSKQHLTQRSRGFRVKNNKKKIKDAQKIYRYIVSCVTPSECKSDMSFVCSQPAHSPPTAFYHTYCQIQIPYHCFQGHT